MNQSRVSWKEMILTALALAVGIGILHAIGYRGGLRPWAEEYDIKGSAKQSLVIFIVTITIFGLWHLLASFFEFLKVRWREKRK